MEATAAKRHYRNRIWIKNSIRTAKDLVGSAFSAALEEMEMSASSAWIILAKEAN